METKENKYPYLSQYEIEQIDKETKEQLKQRLNDQEKKYRQLSFELDHYGKASILISKGGAIIQSLNFNEDTNPNGFRINELKNVANNLEEIYQDYDSNIQTTIILKSDWDETKEQL